MEDRKIIHVDMNSCFANIEVLYRPELRGLPISVHGSQAARRGIILASTREAKQFGIKTGMAIWQAKALCPGLVLVEADYQKYTRHSYMLYKVIEKYTGIIQQYGIDEMWADISHLKMDIEEFARMLCEEVRRKLGVTVSVGASYNMIFAKFASDVAEHGKAMVITRNNYKHLVWPMPVSELFYCGRATTKKMNRIGVTTIKDFAQQNPERLRGILGINGLKLYISANGMDETPVNPNGFFDGIKSVGRSTTTPRDMESRRDVVLTLQGLAEMVATKLRKHNFVGHTAHVSLRDYKLFWFERQRKLARPTCLADEIVKVAMEMFDANCRTLENGKLINPIRSAGIRVSNLENEATGFQLDLFGDELKHQKSIKIAHTLDMIRERYGEHAIVKASLMEDKLLNAWTIKGAPSTLPGVDTRSGVMKV